MALKESTGFRNSILVTGSTRAALNLGFIDIYSGTVPATADSAIGAAVKLCRVSNASTATGLTFEATATGGVLLKASGEVWSGVNIATGVASFYRYVAAGDTGAESTSEVRLQGLVAVAGADMNMSDTTLISAATHTVDYFAIAAPTN